MQHDENRRGKMGRQRMHQRPQSFYPASRSSNHNDIVSRQGILQRRQLPVVSHTQGLCQLGRKRSTLQYQRGCGRAHFCINRCPIPSLGKAHHFRTPCPSTCLSHSSSCFPRCSRSIVVKSWISLKVWAISRSTWQSRVR